MTQSHFDFTAPAATVQVLEQHGVLLSPRDFKAAMLLEHSAEGNGRSFEQCLAAVRKDPRIRERMGLDNHGNAA